MIEKKGRFNNEESIVQTRLNLFPTRSSQRALILSILLFILFIPSGLSDPNDIIYEGILVFGNTTDLSNADHGSLGGLGDNDHPQYQLTSNINNTIETRINDTEYWVNENGDTMTGNLIFQDTISALWGTSSDASITYDGTNWIFNPDAVGSGDMVLEGSMSRSGVFRAFQNGSSSYGNTLFLPGDIDFNDYSGNGNDGVDTNVVTTINGIGMFGEAFSFDGTGDHIEIEATGATHNLAYVALNNYTWMGWINPNNNTNRQVLSKAGCNDGGIGSQGYHFILGSTGKFCWSTANGDETCNYVTSTTTIPTNEWTHWAITQKTSATALKTDLKLYINGILEDSITSLLGSNTVQDIRIGEVDDGYGSGACVVEDFVGEMDEILFFNRTLDDGEIRALYEKNQEFIPLKALARTVNGKVQGDGSALTGIISNVNDTNIDMNGKQLILDADGDSYFQSPSDDRVDLQLGPNEAFIFKRGGSQVTLDTSETTMFYAVSGSIKSKITSAGYFFNSDYGPSQANAKELTPERRTGNNPTIDFEFEGQTASSTCTGGNCIGGNLTLRGGDAVGSAANGYVSIRGFNSPNYFQVNDTGLYLPELAGNGECFLNVTDSGLLAVGGCT